MASPSTLETFTKPPIFTAGFLGSGEIVEGLILLTSTNGGAGIAIHQAAKSVKLGQVAVKLSFAVRDLEAF